MIREIYIRSENDPNFEPGIIDYSNEVENVISQIQMILGTKPGDVLGDYFFGVDIGYAVFNTKMTAQQVRDKIADQISQYVTHGDKISIGVDVNFGDSGKGYDYAVIDISINGEKAIGFLIDKD